MRKGMYGLFIVLACIAIVIWGLLSISKGVIIKYGGKKVTAVVIKLPIECDKYNSIKVLLNEKEYEVSISRKECRDSVYKVGQKVELLKHDNYDELIWPEGYPELVVLLIIVGLVYVFFTVRKHYRK